VLHALAAACAESGRFTEAIAYAQRALALTDASSLPALSELLQSQLSLYRNGEPFRDAEQKKRD
jgi:two-component SAPR family response regulator